jgi:hypothetical protein
MAKNGKAYGGGGGGLLPSVAAMLIMGFVCWHWLLPSLANDEPAAPPQGGSTGELAPVDAQDVPDALATMSGPPEILARFKEAADGCSRPLAWVSIVREPGQPGTSVRLRSGNYFSPLFQLSDVPTRVAIPYPAPYERGQGQLTVVGEGGEAAIALRPTWHVVLQGAGAVRNVTWHPSRRCTLSNG